MFSNFSDFIDCISLAWVLRVFTLYHSSDCKIQTQKQEEIYWLKANSRQSNFFSSQHRKGCGINKRQ